MLKYDPSSIRNGFCDFFSNIGEKYANQIDSAGIDVDNYINNIDPNQDSLYLAPTTHIEIKETNPEITNENK